MSESESHYRTWTQWVTTAVASGGPLFLPSKSQQNAQLQSAMPKNESQMGVKKQTASIQRRNHTITVLYARAPCGMTRT
jgi:hypothetical protein